MLVRPAYICERCGTYSFGEPGAQEIQKHEKIPATGVVKRLDGLIVQIGGDDYSVFRRLPILSPEHQALYTWTNYLVKTLNVKTSGLPPKVEKALTELIKGFDPRDGFLARKIIENQLARHRELSPLEFRRVSRKLATKYPDIYGQPKII